MTKTALRFVAANKFACAGGAGLALMLSLGVLYANDWHFAISAPARADKWGQFGDFLGGVLNPIFGFAGFMGLLFTIRMQQKQFADAQAQTRRDLLMSRIELRTQRVRDLLRQSMESFYSKGKSTFGDNLKLVAYAEEKRTQPYLKGGWDYRQAEIHEWRKKLESGYQDLDTEMQLLIGLFRQWRVAGGEEVLIADLHTEFEKVMLTLSMFQFAGWRESVVDVFPEFEAKLQDARTIARETKGRMKSYAIREAEHEERKAAGLPTDESWR